MAPCNHVCNLPRAIWWGPHYQAEKHPSARSKQSYIHWDRSWNWPMDMLLESLPTPKWLWGNDCSHCFWGLWKAQRWRFSKYGAYSGWKRRGALVSTTLVSRSNGPWGRPSCNLGEGPASNHPNCQMCTSTSWHHCCPSSQQWHGEEGSCIWLAARHGQDALCICWKHWRQKCCSYCAIRQIHKLTYVVSYSSTVSLHTSILKDNPIQPMSWRVSNKFVWCSSWHTIFKMCKILDSLQQMTTTQWICAQNSATWLYCNYYYI